MPEKFDVIDLLFPNVIHDSSQVPGQGHSGDLLTLALLNTDIDGAQRALLAQCLQRGADQQPSEQPITFLANVSGPDPISTAANAWCQTQVASEVDRTPYVRHVK
jgi:hypothetical protein